MEHKELAVLCIGLGLAVASVRDVVAADNSPATTQIAQAEATFTYKDRPIHPMMIHEFVEPIWGGRLVYAVNLDENRTTNLFPQVIRRLANGAIACDQALPENGQGYFGYLHLGVLQSGTHVLCTYENWGGTGVFEELLFVRFCVQKVRQADGLVHERFLLELVDSIPLTDRDSGEIRLMKDRVIVGPSKERKTTMELLEPAILRRELHGVSGDK